MSRLNLFLLAIAVCCALSVVTSQHKWRRLYTELQKETQVTRQIEEDWGRLQLEQSTWAMHTRVEAEATQRLGMQVPGAGRTQSILTQGAYEPKPEAVDKP